MNGPTREAPTPPCELKIVDLGEGMMLFELAGYLTAARAREMIAAAVAQIAQRGKIHVWHDWEQVTGYDLASRLELTRFVYEQRGNFLSAHLLVRNPEVEFGVEVANIVLRNKIRVYHERDRFTASLQRLRARGSRTVNSG